MACLLILIIATVAQVYCDSAGEFSALIDDYWHWRLENSPEFATSVNVHEFDARVEQFTIEVLEQRKENVSNFLSQLVKVDRSQLDAARQISYDVLRDTLETYIAGYKWKNYGPMNPVNFLENLWTDPESGAPANPKTYDDFFNYITRIYGWGDQALNYMKRMRVAISDGTTDNWVSVQAAMDQIDALVGTTSLDSVVYKPLNETLENTTLPESNKTNLRQSALFVIPSFRESFKTLQRFILAEYKNKTRERYGVNALPDGENYYKACLKWHLSIDITPDEIHKKGLVEVDRIHMEMKSVMARLGFHGSTKAFFEKLNNDSKFIIKSPEETIKRFTSIINDRIKPKLPKFFKNIPDRPIVVKPMPTNGPGGAYGFGSPDGSQPGVFYVNVMRPDNNPTYSMVALTMHEADPGHHLQDIYAQNSVGTPTFQKVMDYSKVFSVPYNFPFYTAFTEGWGLYAESLGEKDQLDIYQDDYELMGRYSLEIFRACRLVVDTGIHHYNWSRDTAIEYMLNYTSLNRPSVEIEIDRYITWPGQAVAYKIGELKIKELRKKANNILGSLFDIRDFHSVVLDNGAVPLFILERLVDEYIARVKQSDNLEKIMSEFWSWRMETSPEFSTTIQLYKYNDRLNSYKYEKFETDRIHVQGFLDRILWIDRNGLSSSNKVSYDILKNILEVFLAGYKWKDYEPLNPINFLEGWSTGFDLFLTRIPFDTQGDFVNYARRLELLPEQLDEMMSLSKLAMANGHTDNNASVWRVPGQLDTIIANGRRELYEPFNISAEHVFPDAKHRETVRKRLSDAIGALLNKLSVVKIFITDEYIPHTRSGLGIGSLPNGADNYRACLLFHTSIDISPEAVHQKGLDEVARIEKLVRQTMGNVGFPSSTTISEMYQNLTGDSRFLIKNPEETLARFRSIIFDRIQPQISKYFSHAPNLPLEVRGSATDGVGGEYWTGTADGSIPGIFYANVHKPEYNPTYKMVSLSLHEALPGHHLAESYGILADVPEFRKHYEWLSYSVPYFFPVFNSFAEGWALYSEFLGEEMGMYHDDYEMLGRYSDEMLRATRLVIDSGIHYYNWTRQQSIDYMMNYTAETQSSAAIEVDRYATWPGQACGYKIGELKIKELRQMAVNALGNQFNLADFHYTVLKNGAMPLDVLENIVKEWINSVKQAFDSGPLYVPVQCSETSAAGNAVIQSIVLMVCVSMHNLIDL